MRARAGAITRIVVTLVILIVLVVGGFFVKGILIGLGAISPNFPVASLRMVNQGLLEPQPYFDANTNTSMNYPRGSNIARGNSSASGGSYTLIIKPGEIIGVSVDKNPPNAVLGAVLLASRGKNIPLSGVTGKLTDVHSITVDGHAGYLLDLDLVVNGQAARGRALMIMTPDRKLYTVMAASLDPEWPEAEPVFESAFSTFRFGGAAPRLEVAADDSPRQATYSPAAPADDAPPLPLVDDGAPPAASARDLPAAPASLDSSFSPDAPASPAAPDQTVQIASAAPAPPDVLLNNNVSPAAAPIAVPASPTPDSLIDAVTRLKHPDWNTRYQSVVWLGKQKPGLGEDRSSVTGALADLLADPDGAIHTATLTAIRRWADASTDKVLADKITSAKGDALHDLLDLAAAIKTGTLAEAVAPLLADADERLWARRCLLAMGPVAEHSIAGQLDSQDAGVRVEACRLLEILGTRASIPALKTHLRVTEKDDAVQAAATLAISVIQSRGK
ncbi:MAG TPA: hypothetical protein VHQ47_05620 [Phycisphaerae bacterium]|nr:hypothetical protein [Phycisphaerae bacterium]